VRGSEDDFGIATSHFSHDTFMAASRFSRVRGLQGGNGRSRYHGSP
jgi:hypothetical protein